MNRKVGVWIGLVALSLASSVAKAGPVEGTIRTNGFRVPASEKPGVPGEQELEFECRANEPTRIIVLGDRQPSAELELLVYVLVDGEPRQIMQDSGRDLVGAVFYPVRQARYRIVVRNSAEYSAGNPYNNCYLIVR